MYNMKLSDVLGRVDPSWIVSGSVVIGGEEKFGLESRDTHKASVNGILGVGWKDQMTRESEGYIINVGRGRRSACVCIKET